VRAAVAAVAAEMDGLAEALLGEAGRRSMRPAPLTHAQLSGAA
jgi:hypothetical protein